MKAARASAGGLQDAGRHVAGRAVEGGTYYFTLGLGGVGGAVHCVSARWSICDK